MARPGSKSILDSVIKRAMKAARSHCRMGFHSGFSEDPECNGSASVSLSKVWKTYCGNWANLRL